MPLIFSNIHSIKTENVFKFITCTNLLLIHHLKASFFLNVAFQMEKYVEKMKIYDCRHFPFDCVIFVRHHAKIGGINWMQH